MDLTVDFETYSEVDITTAGAYLYAEHKSTHPLCLSYKIDDQRTKLWVKGTPWPEDLLKAVNTVIEDRNSYIYAFNATFEILIWENCCEGLPVIPLSKWRDVQAVCARFKLPQNLLRAGQALGCQTEKMAVGKVLIRKCCKPHGNPRAQDYIDLGQYCIVDTDVTAEIMERLPVKYLTPSEQKIWELTFKMNKRGVPIDHEANTAIIEYLKVYMEAMKEMIPEITGGEVQTVGQIAKIKKYCLSKGLDIPNVQAGTIEVLLAKGGLPEDVETLLTLRLELGQSSVKKFITIDQMYNNGVVQGNLNYHGAGTGRWAGRGFQFHNLPRAKVAEPEPLIKQFIAKEEIKDPVGKAKALIRSMIKPPEGYSIIVSDFSSIENRVLAWHAGDQHTLDLFANDLDQYKDMASFLYGVEYDDVTKDQRQMGKTIILGCGFGMGKNLFKISAESYGIYLDVAGADAAVQAYRRKYPLIPKMWYKLSELCKMAVKWPGKHYEAFKVKIGVVQDNTGNKWLRMGLPSGRALMYMNPELKDDKYGTIVSYSGINPKTYQWGSKKLTPGLITENVVQACARDFLAHGMLEIEERMPEVTQVLCVHDETGGVIANSDINDSTMKKFNNILCSKVPWMEGLPLKAEGYIGPRYKKD